MNIVNGFRVGHEKVVALLLWILQKYSLNILHESFILAIKVDKRCLRKISWKIKANGALH